MLVNKNSFASSSNYFDRLRRKAREIEEGFDRLDQTWKTPHLLIGGYAERNDEMNACLNELWNSVQNTDDAVGKAQLELELLLEETDQVLEETREVYQDLKENCDGLDIVLSEYGYHYEESNDNAQESHDRDDSKDHVNNDYTSYATGLDEEVEFTPDLTWKSKTRSKGSDASDQHSAMKGIATPVIKSLASVMLSETHNTKKTIVNGDTSVGGTNYSRSFTKALRK